jgi:hypothetical protein
MIRTNVKRKIIRASFSKEIIQNNEYNQTSYLFPDTENFISEIRMKRNAEKLFNVLKRI